MIISKLKILFVQRVITDYRLNLIKEFSNSFQQVGIVSSKGTQTGSLKIAKTFSTLKEYKNISIYILPSIKLNYKGETRSTSLFIYPKAVKYIRTYDLIVFEGTTNILNNSYLIPYAKILKKEIIFWDAGYSLNKRSLKRKIIDFVNYPLVQLSDAQMSYSSLAKLYLEQNMGAKNAFVNLNTIDTSYFENIKDEIIKSIQVYTFDKHNIKLLYVGAIEERKKLKELIDLILLLNKKNKRFTLDIIGGGSYLNSLKEYTLKNDEIIFFGPIYDQEKLKSFYFHSDLFILPGDGGLAILQSLLFGLPVICKRGADGTELDYIKHKPFLLNDLIELKELLENLNDIDRLKIYNNLPDISSNKWIKVFNDKVNELYS